MKSIASIPIYRTVGDGVLDVPRAGTIVIFDRSARLPRRAQLHLQSIANADFWDVEDAVPYDRYTNCLHGRTESPINRNLFLFGNSITSKKTTFVYHDKCGLFRNKYALLHGGQVVR